MTVNLSPSALLAIVVATTIANILILVMVLLRNKGNRARRLAAVESMLSSSYFEGGPGEHRPGPGAEDRDQGGLPYEEAWVTMEREAYDVEGSLEGAEHDDDADVGGPGEDVESEDGTAGQAGIVGQLDGSDRTMETDQFTAADQPVDFDEHLRGTADTASIIGRDPLTGLRDAASFKEILAYEDEREQRYGRPATVVVFELDGLLKIVDRLGPNAGDRIEVALADTIARLARRADYVARLEPGRYGVLLPETDEVAAINYVERIRRACDLWLESGAIAMRLAIGWASTGGDVQLAAAIRTATDRMRLESRRNARSAGDEDAAENVAVAEGVGAGESDNSSNGL